VLIGGLAYSTFKGRSNADMSANYSINIPKPQQGWEKLPHGPQTYFLYGQPKKGLLLRGSVNQMIDSVNPTPELDRDHLARLIVDNTHDNQPGWTAEIQNEVIEAKGTSFRIVRRSEKHHVVVTAFSVKGNTTLLISLSGRDGYADEVDKDMPEFRQFLGEVALTKTDMSKL
jgi:hypothetical protein